MIKNGSYLDCLNYDEALDLFKKNRQNFSISSEVTTVVQEIIKNIQKDGDSSLFNYTEKFDNVKLTKENVKVTQDEIDEASKNVSDEFKKIIINAKKRIENYHKYQIQDSWYFKENKSKLGQLINPINSAGLYIPGGKAAYPSTVLMNAVPAKLAGVNRIMLCSPPGKNGKIPDSVLFAAYACGIDEIYKCGGAQAIAAMAIGTESIEPVDKICGPGNKFVAEAKKLLYGLVDIEMIAGPSEIMIYADEDNDPEFIVADLFSQAEHDEDAESILVTSSKKIINEVNTIIEKKLKTIERADIIKKSLKNNGKVIFVESEKQAYQIINKYAPEHLEILANRSEEEILKNVKNAGAIFIGEYSPEPIGDYIGGPNHTLPTSGTARFSSPLGVYDFMKKSSVINFAEEDFKNIANDARNFALSEGLYSHADSIEVRLKKEK